REVEPGRGRTGREVLAADELRGVVVLVPVLPLHDRAAELRAVGLVEVHVRAVAVRLAVAVLLLLQLLARERRVLRRDAGVDHTDYDALAGVVDAADLLPHAAGAGLVVAEAEEVGR